jgi:hypothetical protein
MRGSNPWIRMTSTLGDIFVVPSPDGRYLAMSREVGNTNAWMLEGF